MVLGATVRLREAFQKTIRCASDFADRGVKRSLVHFGWLVIAADLADKLERGGRNIVGSHRFSGTAEYFDASAHTETLSYEEVAWRVRA
jgi:hypothetical protein